ncbi:MAG: erythromycin esterase family protein [Gammaproteobacteria bacterium]|nr:erythromycin esterase family protein [Gammaproteobacteria bacterium]
MTATRRVRYDLFLSFTLLLIVALSFKAHALNNQQSPSSPLVGSQISILKKSVVPLSSLDDSTRMLELIGSLPYVLIGDSTHGTYEFYQQRINISKKLIQEKNFKLIVLEGDLPNVHRINQYVHSLIPITARQALEVRNPQGAWLWGNVAMLNFIKWLKKYNDQMPEGEQKVSLHGIDIYSFERSKQAVIDYLQMFSPLAAQQAYQRYACFSRFNNNLHHYGKAVAKNPALSCELAAVEQFRDFSDCRLPCPDEYEFIDKEAFFYAQENARIIRNTEKSFRIQYKTGDDSASWNQRDLHMMESFLAVYKHLKQPKTIVWAHNSHLGDARVTEMIKSHQLNIGQLMRQTFGEKMFSIGMLTYNGGVAAADDWNSPTKIKKLRNAHPDSNEALFHSLGISHFLIDLHESEEIYQLLNQTRLQRHVGVVYRPDDEMDSHYTYTHLSDQFNAIIFINTTTPTIALKNN